MASLDDLIGALAAEWGLTVETPFERSTTSLVMPVFRADGTPAVLKLAGPSEDLQREVTVLQHLDGRGCVRLFRYDEQRGAVLLERLGRQLFQLDLPIGRQHEIIYQTVRQLWSVPGPVALPSGAEKARWLGEFIARSWDALARPCSSLVIDAAVSIAGRLAASFDERRAVLVHSDAHAWNTLEDPAAPGRFRLVDPDGFWAEPECDMAISMREYPDELLAGDAVALGRARARSLARMSGLDEGKIWDWGFVEVAANGLSHLSDGNVSNGQPFLGVAEAWARDM